jgi:hypothetical protein
MHQKEYGFATQVAFVNHQVNHRSFTGGIYGKSGVPGGRKAYLFIQADIIIKSKEYTLKVRLVYSSELLAFLYH